MFDFLARLVPGLQRCAVLVISALAILASLVLASPAMAQQSTPLLPPADADAGLSTPTTIVGPNRSQEIDGQEAPSERRPQQPSSTSVTLLGALGLVALAAVSLALAAVAGSTLWWMLHAWHTPVSLRRTGFAAPVQAPRRSFSLIVPARHEQAVLGDTLDRLAALDHPDFEVLAVIGHDDPETAAVAEAAALRHPGRVRVMIDDSVPKNKPRALNTALAECRGEITGVFDAEDEVHPDLLRHVDARFDDTGADVVQGGVQLMNLRSSWYALRNVLEYYFWFRSRLHFQATQRFIPLGGNTVFVRTDLLRQVGGWDPMCLAEDCELGVRLSARGAKVAVAYDPELVTREETPDSVGALIKQRTRWNQGFLQVLSKGEWRKLPTRRQRLLARYTLTQPFLQALSGVMLPISAVLIFAVDVPVPVALLTFLPIVPTLITLVVEMAGLGEFCKSYGIKARLRDYIRLVVGALPYQVMLAVAALRAVLRQARGNHSWEKTSHAGLHRQPGSARLEPVIDIRGG